MKSVYWEDYPMFGIIVIDGESCINRAAVAGCAQNRLVLQERALPQYTDPKILTLPLARRKRANETTAHRKSM